jgi:3-isopropylmalate/(R)-2-methylmalate dehydratase small subunit
MQAVQIVQGTALPLDRSDVDTDQIIPAEWLKRVERTGFGKGLFSSWRDDRSFVLNDERFAGANVPVQVSNEVGEQLLAAVEADATLELVVDVDRRTLSAPAIGLEEAFPLEDSVRERFLEGLDDIGITLRTEDAITTFEATRPTWLPIA